MRKQILTLALALSFTVVSMNARSADQAVKAVIEKNADKGFRLTDAATKTLDLEFQGLTTDRVAAVPAKSLVFYRDQVGIYRNEDGWLKLIPVKLKHRSGESALIEGQQLRKGMKFAVKGVSLLRVADIDAFSGGEAP